MSQRSQSLPPAAKEAGSTSLSMETLSYRWTIHGAIKCLEKSASLQSPWFHCVQKYCFLDITQKKNSSFVTLSLNPNLNLNAVSNCKFYILSHEGPKIFIPNDDGKISFKPSDYIYHDTLSIQVEGDVEVLAQTRQTQTDNIRKGMHSLYNNEALVDTTIKCRDKEFKVHRAVLASQSPVFRGMFEADMNEKQSGVIEVSDITPEAMSDLVTYLYTGTTPDMKSELLEVADKYQLTRLLTICENELSDNIKDTNVVKTLILADLHGRPALKKACFQFISLNSAEVFQTSEWADFKECRDQYASLFMEVLEYVLTK